MRCLKHWDRSTVGECVRYQRQRQRMSQMALAGKLGTDQSLLSRIERDKRRASSELLERIADALGVEMVALLPVGRPMARAG